MTETLTWPRALDHCVLPTADLDVAARRFAALGFTVAPIGVHPFGTANHCVYFADGTFLEMLAVGDESMAQAAAAAGNVFVAHDRTFRQRIGAEGFSAIVLQTGDARQDHEDFLRAGVSAGEILDFSRAFVDAAGSRGEASFRLAFARNAKAPVLLVFACERIAVPRVDRGALQRHPNGVTAIKRIGISAAGLEAVAPIAAAIAPAHGAGLVTQMAAPAVAGQTTNLLSVTFAVDDLMHTSVLLDHAGIAYTTTDRHLSVASAAGQGATFIFEASE